MNSPIHPCHFNSRRGHWAARQMICRATCFAAQFQRPARGCRGLRDSRAEALRQGPSQERVDNDIVGFDHSGSAESRNGSYSSHWFWLCKQTPLPAPLPAQLESLSIAHQFQVRARARILKVWMDSDPVTENRASNNNASRCSFAPSNCYPAKATKRVLNFLQRPLLVFL